MLHLLIGFALLCRLYTNVLLLIGSFFLLTNSEKYIFVIRLPPASASPGGSPLVTFFVIRHPPASASPGGSPLVTYPHIPGRCRISGSRTHLLPTKWDDLEPGCGTPLV